MEAHRRHRRLKDRQEKRETLTLRAGACAEITAAATIAAADCYGLPVSTTPCSPPASPTMAATDRSAMVDESPQLALAWVLTLPAG